MSLTLQSQEIDVAIDTRQIIRDRLKQLDKTKYWLAEQVHGEIARASIYSYLRHERPTDISSQALSRIFEVLAIDIIPRKR